MFSPPAPESVIYVKYDFYSFLKCTLKYHLIFAGTFFRVSQDLMDLPLDRVKTTDERDLSMTYLGIFVGLEINSHVLPNDVFIIPFNYSLIFFTSPRRQFLSSHTCAQAVNTRWM